MSGEPKKRRRKQKGGSSERDANPTPRAAQVVDDQSGSGDGMKPAYGVLKMWRVGFVALVVCGLFGAVIAKAYGLQVGRAGDLSAEAESQLAGRIEIQARRGAIYDRHGAEMAVSVRAESLFVRPRQIVAPRDTAAALAPLLGRSEVSLLRDLSHEGNFRYLARRVAPRVAAAVMALEIPGVDTMNEWQRYYPMRYRAGHVVGFTGDDDIGLEGIERAMDSVLSGGSLEVLGLRDAEGRPILAGDGPELAALEGYSIRLTLDAQIQRIAERELERVVVERGARTGLAVVMDPHTGEVLAMTNWPLFDPNRFRFNSPSDWRNRSVTDAWEPGSTMKVFTYAAALEAGMLTPDDVLDCAGGRLQIGRYRIRDTHYDDENTAERIITVSSNIGAYRMGQLVGDQGLYDAFRAFGFGQSSSSGLGGEQAGLLASPPWAEIELANRAFGQGVTATPIQLALGFSVIANGGELMYPMLVSEIVDKDGRVIEHREPEVRRRVISAETAALVMRAMETVTGDEGTGHQAAILGIRVAGKTGTAQKVDPETGMYGDLWMASFVGIVPADDPIFTIVVMIDEPTEGRYGGEVAGPVFARIAEQALATRGIFPDRSAPETAADVVDPAQEVQGQVADVEEPPASESLSAGLEGLGDGLGIYAMAVPNRSEGASAGRSERVTVPDLAGLNLVEALELAASMSLLVDVHDWGAVEHQWPAPGASVLRESEVELYFRAPYQATQNADQTRNEDRERRGNVGLGSADAQHRTGARDFGLRPLPELAADGIEVQER